MSETVDTTVAASIKITLKADSGYESNIEGRISPEQWGRICAIMDEGLAPAKPVTQNDGWNPADTKPSKPGHYETNAGVLNTGEDGVASYQYWTGEY